MKFEEAVVSGRKIRRATWKEPFQVSTRPSALVWLFKEEGDGSLRKCGPVILPRYDVEAEDWEVMPE